MQFIKDFWTISCKELMSIMKTQIDGLSEEEASRRIQQQERSGKKNADWYEDVFLFLRQYQNPLVLILIFASLLSFLLKEYTGGVIVLVILFITGFLSFIQESNAGRVIKKLQTMTASKACVIRSGKEKEILISEVVPGDIVLIRAGDLIPADGILCEANDLHVNEAILTGESFPTEKTTETSLPGTPMVQAKNAVFKGTSVVNGTAIMLAIHTGDFTELGKIISMLRKAPDETAFEKGVKRFGMFLMRVTVLIALAILILNVLFNKPIIDSILFALALSVGMTPELLPAVLTVTLSAGARKMASKKVIVKKLNAVQNLGEIDVLCSDKTGTLTEGAVKLHSAVDSNGEQSDKVLQYAYLNAFFESGFPNPIDEAIRNVKSISVGQFQKIDEIPYDFIRKKLSILVTDGKRNILITKGAVNSILSCCDRFELNGECMPIQQRLDQFYYQFNSFSRLGFRTIAVCYKNIDLHATVRKEDENGMIFLGFITFYDPPKEGIADIIQRLKQDGISLKIISGDHPFVVKYIADQIGIHQQEILIGSDLMKMTEEALQHQVNRVNLFAEIEPIQKERIIRALQKNNHVVGFLGDGINDANALRTADVGISVDRAVDVAKDAADIILLEKDMRVIRDGVIEGRKTFMNTQKYIFVVTSANFGNMISMAFSSLALPFLPLLPQQILLNNLLSDIPSLAIGTDAVDHETLISPKRWDIHYIQRFMIVFGIQSSVFDFFTFAVLLFIFHTSAYYFRVGWFTEGLLTQVFTLLIIRTHRPIWKSKPDKYLLATAMGVSLIVLLLPYLPVRHYFQLSPLSLPMLMCMLFIVLLYILTAEITKKWAMSRI